ncbi:nucleotidyltransferase family protein [Plastoroseomonas arctica]|uniref:Nucleotidyltransferase family protein n=1 Tax=Plastoroseomonas arctica TaxID=1509237 RepID=A0AAF1K0Y2_9PROT|nr:nucleotidyltransferase family protein [Plastoroseomonas arctica]MBR0654290.1 nucleotidyltransferase family protein [Plastoroseomonas arctica]
MITLTHAMVLAAGLGTRMRPLTDERPKPLLPLGGRSLLDHALDRLDEAGVRQAVVNAHWRGAQIAPAVEGRATPAITVRHEDVLLETGGGVAAALPLLGDGPFAVVNGDAFWLNGPSPALSRLAAAFDDDAMDALLLVVRTAQVEGEVGRGDFLLDPLGHARRPKEHEMAPYLFGGVQILSPRLFAQVPEGPFSLNLLYDRAIEAGRLFGLVHDGVWFHLSTPRDLKRAELALRTGLARAPF